MVIQDSGTFETLFEQWSSLSILIQKLVQKLVYSATEAGTEAGTVVQKLVQWYRSWANRYRKDSFHRYGLLIRKKSTQLKLFEKQQGSW